jgi:hypothetical protein
MLEQHKITVSDPENQSHSSESILKEFLGRNDRQRGLWSFLTWAFFLAQIVAADEFIGGGAAHASQNLDDPHHASDGGDADGSSHYNPDLDSLGSLAQSQDQGAAGAQNALQAAQHAAQDVAVPGMEHIDVGQVLDAVNAANAAAQGAGVAVASLSEEIPGDGAGDTGNGSNPGSGSEPGNHDGSNPGDGITIGDIHIPSDILPDLGLVLDPVADLVDTALTDVVQPVLGTAQVALNDVFHIVGDVADGLGGTLSSLGDTVGDGLDHLLPGTGSLVAELTHTLDDTLHNTTEPLVTVLQDTTNVAFNALDSTVSAVNNLLGGALNFAPEHVDVANAPNDLSTGTIHTDYGVALSTGVGEVVTKTFDVVDGVTGTASSLFDSILGDHHANDTPDSGDGHQPNVVADAIDHLAHNLFG